MTEWIGYPLSGVCYFEVEATYGAGFSGSQSRFSDSVIDARIETGDINMELRSISEPSLVGFQKAMVDPTLHIEYIYQPHAGVSAVTYFYTRSGCDLDSMAIEIGASTCSAESTYYYLTGCKAKSFTVSGTKGDAYKISVDFSVASLGIYGTAQGSDPGAIGTDYAMFSEAGSITWAGVTGAYITESFEFTVDNNLSEYYDVGSTEKVQAIPGARDITGSCDISMDGGGETHFDEVLAATDITSVKLDTGLATGAYGEFELENGRFDSTNIDLNTSSEGLMSSVPFTFRGLTFNAGTP